MSSYLAACEAVDAITDNHKLCAAIVLEAFLRRVTIDEDDGQPGAQTFDEAVRYSLVAAVDHAMKKNKKVAAEAKKRY